MYERKQEIQECWEKNEWYEFSDTSDVSENLLYNPDDEAMETLEALKPDWFVYHKPFLLSRDRSILYGFTVSEDSVLEIPESVIVYDNLFLHEEAYGYKKIYIGENLEEIVNVQNAFGFYVEDYVVNKRNSCFASDAGILYDMVPDEFDDSRLILFPSGRGISSPELYVQYNVDPSCELVIGEYAFFMKGFIKAMVLPPNTEIEDNAFFIKDGRGVIFADHYVGNQLLEAKSNGRIEGTDIKCYECGEVI